VPCSTSATFGHAIETEQGYSAPGRDALNHGEAVAVGMVLAAKLSTDLGLADDADARACRRCWNASACRWRSRPGWTRRPCSAACGLDKKNVAGRLRLVLWRGMGRAEVVPDVDEAAVLKVLSVVRPLAGSQPGSPPCRH
jgi:3-dehydroquinate synthase